MPSGASTVWRGAACNNLGGPDRRRRRRATRRAASFPHSLSRVRRGASGGAPPKRGPCRRAPRRRTRPTVGLPRAAPFRRRRGRGRDLRPPRRKRAPRSRRPCNRAPSPRASQNSRPRSRRRRRRARRAPPQNVCERGARRRPAGDAAWTSTSQIGSCTATRPTTRNAFAAAPAAGPSSISHGGGSRTTTYPSATIAG